MTLLKQYRPATKQDDETTGVLKACGSLFSECGSFYKSVAAQFRAKKINTARKQQQKLSPEDTQRFLQALLADDGSGSPGLEERFRRSLLAHEVYPEDGLPPVVFPPATSRRKKENKASTLKPLVLSHAKVTSTAAEAPRAGVVEVEAKETIKIALGRLGFQAWA